jgi:hypothetical protein
MPIKILTDFERLKKWNDICIAKGWAKEGELEKLYKKANIQFTPGGSCMAPEVLTVKVTRKEDIPQITLACTGEAMATHVIEAYTGFLVFASTELDSEFWRAIIGRLDKEFDIFMPPELVPKYVRDILKYPADGEGELPT